MILFSRNAEGGPAHSGLSLYPKGDPHHKGFKFRIIINKDFMVYTIMVRWRIMENDLIIGHTLWKRVSADEQDFEEYGGAIGTFIHEAYTTWSGKRVIALAAKMVP